MHSQSPILLQRLPGVNDAAGLPRRDSHLHAPPLDHELSPPSAAITSPSIPVASCGVTVAVVSVAGSKFKLGVTRPAACRFIAARFSNVSDARSAAPARTRPPVCPVPPTIAGGKATMVATASTTMIMITGGRGTARASGGICSTPSRTAALALAARAVRNGIVRLFLRVNGG